MDPKPVKNFREAVAKIENLHGNMAVLSRLGPLLKDPNSDIGDLSRLIQSDSGLAASIVRISNSSLYGMGQRVGDVPSALSKVGFNQVLRLVGVALSKQVFMRDLEVYGISANDYWSQSYFAGLFLEEIAPRIGIDKDDAYMVGLLHAVGKVVLNELVSPSEVAVFWDPTFSSEEWEEIMFGVHYDEAGAELLERWKFPDSIYERVKTQLDKGEQSRDRILGALAFINSVLALNLYEFEREEWELPHSHPFFEQTNSDPDVLGAEIRRSMIKLEDIRRTIQKTAS